MLFACLAKAQVITDTVLNKASTQPFGFSVAVPDGNYLVTVTLGNKKKQARRWSGLSRVAIS